jgi:hypothetical protein
LRSVVRALLAALLLLPCAALAEPPSWSSLADRYPQAIIDRPLMLPQNTVELNLLGNVTTESGLQAGESVALGVEVGLGEGQGGIVLALPAAPGFGFGSIFGSTAWAVGRKAAFRADLGLDHSGGDIGRAEAWFYSAGAGFPFEVRLGEAFALVSGRVGAMGVAHFVNLDVGGAGFYRGASQPFSSADLLVYTKRENGESQVTVNLPIGLLAQVAPGFAVTLRTGFEAIIVASGPGGAQYFVPLGADAVFSPSRALDIGASFSIAGQVAQSAPAASAGYTDLFMGSLWLRLRV